jgi:hypothetical protein
MAFRLSACASHTLAPEEPQTFDTIFMAHGLADNVALIGGAIMC